MRLNSNAGCPGTGKSNYFAGVSSSNATGWRRKHMCGIAGFMYFDGAPVDKTLIESMSNLLTHRGPDGGGIHLGKGAALGHRRLSIIDVSSGQQPLSNEDGSVWITFNGEIYNYRDLNQEL